MVSALVICLVGWFPPLISSLLFAFEASEASHGLPAGFYELDCFCFGLCACWLLRWYPSLGKLALDSLVFSRLDLCHRVHLMLVVNVWSHWQCQVPDIPAAIEAVALAFYEGEPVMLASGGTLRDWQRFAEMYVPRMAAEGHTVLAVEKASGQIIGAFLNEDFNNPDPQDFEHFLESSDGDWRPIIGMVEDLEESLMKAHSIPLQASERPAGQFFHLWMIGVSSSARGRGVATKLFHHSLALAKAWPARVGQEACLSISLRLAGKWLF